jgi:deazaflavin-dependent oxidoreductase (nitroreductase family)
MSARTPAFEQTLRGLGDEAFCYLTTVGRRSGRRHTIEIWFALHGTTLYMLAGGGRNSDWVRNLIETPSVRVRIGRRTFAGRARVVADGAEKRRARRLLPAKYQPGYDEDLSEWRRTALPVAVDLDAPAATKRRTR